MTALLGMGIAAGADLRHFLNADALAAIGVHVLRRLAAHGADLALIGAGCSS